MRIAPNVLTEAQRREYFRNGYLSLPNYVPETWLKKLHDSTSDLLERSRKIEQSDATYVLEDGHSQDNPRLHRVTSPQDHHPAFWDFICSDVMTNLVADVVGPDVKFHHAKLHVKSGHGKQIGRASCREREGKYV